MPARLNCTRVGNTDGLTVLAYGVFFKLVSCEVLWGVCSVALLFRPLCWSAFLSTGGSVGDLADYLALIM